MVLILTYNGPENFCAIVKEIYLEALLNPYNTVKEKLGFYSNMRHTNDALKILKTGV